MDNFYDNDSYIHVSSSLEELFIMARRQARSYVGAVGPYERMCAEQEVICQWFEKKPGRYTTSENLDEALFTGRSYKDIEGGNEHNLYAPEEITDSVRIFKLTKSENGYGARSSLSGYLENLLFSNIIFDDSITLHMAIEPESPKHVYRLLTSQLFVRGDEASQERITDYMESLGFVQDKSIPSIYRHPCGTVIYDARPANVIETQDGQIFPIDIQIFHGDKYVYWKIVAILKFVLLLKRDAAT